MTTLLLEKEQEAVVEEGSKPQYYEKLIEYEEDSENLKDWVSLSENTLDINLLTNFARSPKVGAISSFLGTTRDNFEDKTVTYLEYEAYPEMALTAMLQICTEIRKKWSVQKIVMQHKIGPCPVLETSIVIIISSAHRKDSLHASQFAIDELKRIVPIWKKEFYKEGEAKWKSNQNP